ncbi:PIN domain-containing protein [Pendulispora rubella]|uniref:Ribonuclease VapC n=1 Tax=Pendulispora rubella TaxID=2741070 RepID=A0ABZ2L8C7_9BACT
MSYLVDTKVISELVRPAPNPHVLQWFEGQREVALSAISVEELSYGIARAPPVTRRRLVTWFEALLALPAEIVPVDATIARASGDLRAHREGRGLHVAQADMLIAATALITGRTLVTRNTRDFEGCGVALLDPFT